MLGDSSNFKGEPDNNYGVRPMMTIKGDSLVIGGDGTTRVLSNFTVGPNNNDDISCTANSDSDVIVYDPRDQMSVAYFINNDVTAYVNIEYFANHVVKIPIYDNIIIYQEEVETKEYKVKLSAPNMYEMFAAQPIRDGKTWSYWLINSSKANRKTGIVYNVGVVINGEVSNFLKANVRIAAYLKKGMTVSMGDGTYDSPYVVK